MALLSNPIQMAAAAAGVPASRSFSTQYLSLILIILTFIIGIFSSNRLQQRSLAVPNPAQQGRIESVYTAKQAKLEFDDLFVAGSAELHREKLSALVALLQAHDLDAEFYVRAEDGMTTAEALALARATTLHRAFVAQNVPLRAFSVIATEEREGPQVKILFERSAE